MIDFILRDPHPDQCCHEPNDPKTSLKFIRGFTTMEHPQHVYSVCTACGRSFEYILEDDGSLTEVVEDDQKE